MLFRYAMEEGLVEKIVRFGPGFKAPSKKVLRRSRRLTTESRGARMFERSELLAILDEAKGQLRTMILLAINGGFGQTDCANLPRSAVDLASGWIDFPRPKTETDRRVPLWPETIEALREVAETERRPAKGPANEELVFLTIHGNRWTRMRRTSQSDGRPDQWTAVDLVAL